MSYQEKRSIVSIISGVIILGAYCFYAFGKYQSGALAAEDLKGWAATMLVFTGIGIAANIAIQIVFHILLSMAIAVREKMKNDSCDEKTIDRRIETEMTTDEMDQLIELKSMRTGYAVAGIGFIASLSALALGSSSMAMVNMLFLSFSAGSIFEGLTRIYFYRRGVSKWPGNSRS